MSSNEQTELLKEILKWIRFSSIREVRTVLMEILNTEQKRIVYHLSDGQRGSIEIGTQVRISHVTVTRYWESWKRMGIVEPVKVRGGLRYRKLFELEDFGLSVPNVAVNGGVEHE
jgi:hypothetical protein